MKSFLILIAFFSIISVANAREIEVPGDMPLVEVLKRATCEMKVTKPITFLKNESYVAVKHFLISVKHTENSVRKVPEGRKIKIYSVDQYFINFNDKTLDRACLRKTLDWDDNFCTPLKDITISDIEKQSENSVTIICQDDEPTEI